MITNGAVNFDIELRRSAVFTLSYDITVDGVVLSLSGKTHTLKIRQTIDDVEVFSKAFTPDVDNVITVLLTEIEIATLSANKSLDFYIIETGNVMIAYGNCKVIK